MIMSSQYKHSNIELLMGICAGAIATGSLWWWQSFRKRQLVAKHLASTDAIYLDYNGTTPIYPSVLDAMIPFLQQHYGNPGSTHWAGTVPREAVEAARRQILRHILGCDDSTPVSACVFTACGTESDNLAIHWALEKAASSSRTANPGRNDLPLPHVVTCNVEHPAMEACLLAHERAGRCTVTRVPVQRDGRVLAADVIAAIQPHTALVTLMLANNETGALQPVREVSEYCRRERILIATDAAQAVGKVSVHLEDLGYPDLVTIVGHKFGAPKGIACLYVRPGCLGDGTKTTGLLIGGGQEFGRRAGTENVPYIVGMGVAAELCARNLLSNQQHMEALRNRLLQRLQEILGIHSVHVNGPKQPDHRLPNTLSVGFTGGIHSARLLAAIRHQVAASAGAACHSTQGPVSGILQAMQIPESIARATIRLSVGPTTTAAQVDRAATLLAQEVMKQRNSAS